MAMQLPVHRSTYDDYPACLGRFKWLIESGLRSPSSVFTMGMPSYSAAWCKACGDLVPVSEHEKHVKAHAYQLNLVSHPPSIMVGKGAVKPVAIEPDVASINAGASVVAGYRPAKGKAVSQLELEIQSTVFDSFTDRASELAFDYGYGPLRALVTTAIVSVTSDGFDEEPPICADCGADE